MRNTERVTVTLPTALIAGIDQWEKNRSRFIATAVRNELHRRRKEGMMQSIRHPHAEALEVAEFGMSEWASRLPREEKDLVDPGAGRAVRWIEGEGWIELED